MFATPALASHCQPRERWVEFLKDEYGEQPVAFALTNEGGVLEKFSAPDGKTWTLLVTSPDGTSCGIAAGEGNWQEATPKLLKEMGQPI